MRYAAAEARIRSSSRGGGSSSGFVVLAILLMAAGWPDAPAQAHMKGMYSTREEAEKRAAELKCKGVFAMGTMWMPCANERALHEALQKAP